jgi:hypothetical protein
MYNILEPIPNQTFSYHLRILHIVNLDPRVPHSSIEVVVESAILIGVVVGEVIFQLPRRMAAG